MKQKLFQKNFTFLVLGQVFSLIGNFTLKFALSMYVLEETGSAAVFAGLLAAAMLPTILLSPFGGIVADRLNRRNIMVGLDFFSGVSVLIVFLLLGNEFSLPLIGGLLFVLSILGAFESPTVQAAVPQMQHGENILKGNAVVNQVSAIASLVTPFLGSIVYTVFGMKTVLLATVCCFFLTALLECFIQLPYQKLDKKQSAICILREDFSDSMNFLRKDQPNILKLLCLAAFLSFFIVGISVIGLPFLVRTVLGLSAEHYGVAESALGIAAILGGLSVNLLVQKLKVKNLYCFMVIFGICMLLAGMIFLLPATVILRYVILLISFCGGQMACNIFSIFSLSVIQQRTPQQMTGKVMSYVFTISMCAQPLGQMVYGFLFDLFADQVFWVLIPTGLMICLTGWFSVAFFKRFDQNGDLTQEKHNI